MLDNEMILSMLQDGFRVLPVPLTSARSMLQISAADVAAADAGQSCDLSLMLQFMLDKAIDPVHGCRMGSECCLCLQYLQDLCFRSLLQLLRQLTLVNLVTSP